MSDSMAPKADAELLNVLLETDNDRLLSILVILNNVEEGSGNDVRPRDGLKIKYVQSIEHLIKQGVFIEDSIIPNVVKLVGPALLIRKAIDNHMVDTSCLDIGISIV